MFISVLVGCTLGVTDPEPSDCQNFIATGVFFETEEACEFTALSEGQPYLLQQGKAIHDVLCIKTDIFPEPKEGEVLIQHHYLVD